MVMNSKHAGLVLSNDNTSGRQGSWWETMISSSGGKARSNNQESESLVWNDTNLLGKDLAAFSRVVKDHIAIVINYIAYGNHAKHMERPL